MSLKNLFLLAAIALAVIAGLEFTGIVEITNGGLASGFGWSVWAGAALLCTRLP
jgi:hypothetical protein